jgi:hypothetical protein
MNQTKTLWLACIVVVGLVGCTPDAERNEDGQVIADGDIDAFAMRIGDCFDDTSGILSVGQESVSDLPGRPCTEPHDNEVFATFDADLSTFPGSDEITEFGNMRCEERFADYVGSEYESSSLALFAITPTQNSWIQYKDREVICALYDMNEQKLTRSMRDSGE